MTRKRMTDEEAKQHIIDGFKRGLTGDALRQYVRTFGSIAATPLSKIQREALSEFAGVADLELIDSNISLARKVQRLADLRRIENKTFREQVRLDNALDAVGKQIVEILSQYDFSNVSKEHPTVGAQASAIVQLADLHMNELVQTQMNVYDFEVASKRLQKYARKVVQLLTADGVKHVVVANTGDTLNSDRRLDEYLSQATNRTSATMLAVHLLKEFLLDLNRYFNITYIQVSGNESRLKDEPGTTDVVLTDNYDFLIYNLLKGLLATSNGITFQDGDVSERVISMGGANVLVTHGEQIGQNTAIRDVQSIKGKYAQYGVPVEFVVCGHIHAAHVHDHFARSASLVGANAYTDRGLQLTARASQNVHVWYPDGSHDTYVIDLQTTDGFEGYPIAEQLAYYNAKSEKKLHTQTVIHQVVI